jgi:flavin-binding protein dodecin
MMGECRDDLPSPPVALSWVALIAHVDLATDRVWAIAGTANLTLGSAAGRYGPASAFQPRIGGRSRHKGADVLPMLNVMEVHTPSNESWNDAAQQPVKGAWKTIRTIKSIPIHDMQVVTDSGKIANQPIDALISFLLDGR